jgi:hypothetical protein
MRIEDASRGRPPQAAVNGATDIGEVAGRRRDRRAGAEQPE